jgi:hypothetical protein
MEEEEENLQQAGLQAVNQASVLQKDSPTSYAKTLANNLPCPSKPQVSNEEVEFVKVVSKKNKQKNPKKMEDTKSSSPPLAQPTPKLIVPRPLRAVVKNLSSKEEILQKLTVSQDSPPIVALEEKKGEAVSGIYIQTSLSRMAAKDPLFSFMKVFETVTGFKPLGISLMSKTVAEIFVPTSNVQEIISKIPPHMMVLSTPKLSISDVKRRAASYNRGFFKGLRRASLDGLNNGLALQILSVAEAAINNLPFHRQKSVKKAIAEDRLWVESQ